MKKLFEQITVFLNLHSTIEDAWLEHILDTKVVPVNMKSKKISDIDGSLFVYIWQYRMFISTMVPFITIELMDADFSRFRVKEVMSTHDKIRNKLNDPRVNYGRVEIIKVLNDILGARIVLTEEKDYSYLVDAIKNNFSSIEVRDSSKNGYRAVHVYTKAKLGSLKWEIQIWNKSDETPNMLLHEKYKRRYLIDLKTMGEENGLHS